MLMAANVVLSCHVSLQYQCVLDFCHTLQPKQQSRLGDQTEAHADVDQSRRTRDALDTTTASPDPLATQLDVQASHLAEAAEVASSMASLSATNILAGSEELSNVYTSQDEADSPSTHAGGNFVNENQLQRTSRPEDDDQHV